MADIGFNWIQWPYARIRREIETASGIPTRFVYQLEYDIAATPAGTNESNWKPVVRFDHNTDESEGHDIREEGLHLDIYKNGRKYQVQTDFPTVPINQSPDYCEKYLEEYAPRFLERFERWHDLAGPWRIQSESE